jgi:hypothetical protein
MSNTELAHQIATAFAPVLPFLVAKLAKAADASADILGTKGTEKLLSAWARIRSAFRSNSNSTSVIDAFESQPANPKSMSEFVSTLAAHFETDPALGSALATDLHIIQEYSAHLERSIVIAGQVRNSIIITGNDNNISDSSKS